MSNKEVVSLENVVKSDSSVEQRVLPKSRASIKQRLFEHSIGLEKLYDVLCLRWRLVEESHTLINLVNNHEFISLTQSHESLGSKLQYHLQYHATNRLFLTPLISGTVFLLSVQFWREIRFGEVYQDDTESRAVRTSPHWAIRLCRVEFWVSFSLLLLVSLSRIVQVRTIGLIW